MGAALELAAVRIPAKEFWSGIEYFGTLSAPGFFFLLALEFSHQAHPVSRRNLALLAAVPLFTLALALTNPLHRLIWTSFTPSPHGRNLIVYGHGLMWWIGVVGYTYLLIFAGMGLIAGASLRFPAPYRRQALALLVSAAIPWTLNVFYVLGHSPAAGWDPTPQAFGLTGIIFAWNLFRYQLGDLVPVARHRLIEHMQEGVMVLDAGNRVVDVNPAASILLGTASPIAIGQPAGTALAAWPECAANLHEAQESRIEIERHAHAACRHLEMTFSPLTSPRGLYGGHLITMRDITERKLAALERERLLAQLQQALSEVRTLSGLLPICAGCKKIRDDSGYWTQIESYIQQHSNASFSHGLLPRMHPKALPRIENKGWLIKDPEHTTGGAAEGNMVIRMPMRLKRDRGRKQVVAPSGLEGPVIFNRGQAQQALVLALARAYRWSRMLEKGEVSSINELAEQQGVDPSLIGRTLRLATLAPDITQAILAGQESNGISIRRLTETPPICWHEQRQKYAMP